MDKDKGLVRCGELLGHGDWAPVFLGYLMGTQNAVVETEVIDALLTAKSKYELPVWVESGLQTLQDRKLARAQLELEF